MAEQMRAQGHASLGRIAVALDEPRSSVGRWVRPGGTVRAVAQQRTRPVSGDPGLREQVSELCARPRRVERMRPTAADRAWQIDMTSLTLADLTPLFLVVVIDCFSRLIVGWTLDRRCRAGEWTAALRMGLERRALLSKEQCSALVLRSDSGAQPCSKQFVEFLSSRGIQGQSTGYDAPDDNAFVERVIRTIKEEEIWLNEYETFSEAHAAIESFVNYYNAQRLHSALGYRTPEDFAAANLTLAAA